MDLRDVKEVMACLPKGETPFYYSKDGYAPFLLKHKAGPGARIADLKRSALGRLLDKAPLKEALSNSGDGMLRADALAEYRAHQALAFVLSLSRWGGVDRQWHQTSRQGYNLVLQLNFAREHDKRYREMVQPRRDALFNYKGHPVLRKGQREFFFETLAWARVDVDFKSGTALIEEIQSDWVRESRVALWERMHHTHKWSGRYWATRMGGSRFALAHYVREVLQPYARLWDEAVLMATIQFLREELGLRTVYYHNFETGAAAKSIERRLPPRSLYTELPRRFCFERTAYGPPFLMQDPMFRRRVRRASERSWYRLQL